MPLSVDPVAGLASVMRRAGAAVLGSLLRLVGPLPELDQAVALHLRVRIGRGPVMEMFTAIKALRKALDEALTHEMLGIVGESRNRDGEWIIFLEVHDADAAFQAIEPVLKAFPIANGGYAVKWYGEVGKTGVRHVHETW